MSKKHYLPDTLLKTYGCANCVWRQYGMCPHNLREGEIYTFTPSSSETASTSAPTNLSGSNINDNDNDLINSQEEKSVTGYCPEFADFLFSLMDNGSISNLKEKFMMYTMEIQSLIDHKEFMKLQSRFNDLRESGASPSELKELGLAIELYKTWWMRLTESVVKGHSKIADRESRSKDVETGSKKITVQQLNVLLRESSKRLQLG